MGLNLPFGQFTCWKNRYIFNLTTHFGYITLNLCLQFRQQLFKALSFHYFLPTRHSYYNVCRLNKIKHQHITVFKGPHLLYLKERKFYIGYLCRKSHWKSTLCSCQETVKLTECPLVQNIEYLKFELELKE